MKPTLTDFLESAARWRGTHAGVSYELSWHGRSDYSTEGIWCWYIYLVQEQFYPEDWEKLRLRQQDVLLFESWRRHWAYEDFPDLEPHGGWTFGEMYIYLGSDGKEYERIKIGCDYAHSWDRDQGYWHGKNDIERDVKRSIDLLLKMFPKRRLQCAYTGRWGEAEEFYLSENGPVLKTCEEKLRADGGARWLPKAAKVQTH